METTQEQEQPVEQPVEGQDASVQEGEEIRPTTPAARQFQAAVGRLGQLTISLMQARDELADKQRQYETLGAEITQRRLRIEADEREQLRLQGAAGALQTLVQGEQGEDAADA
jgi:hypothetical protein